MQKYCGDAGPISRYILVVTFSILSADYNVEAIVLEDLERSNIAREIALPLMEVSTTKESLL